MKPIVLTAFLMTSLAAWSQTGEHAKVLETGKNPKAVHVNAYLGLGLNYWEHVVNSGKRTSTTGSGNGNLSNHTYVEFLFPVLANLKLSADLVEKESLYLNANGFFTFGYRPLKSSTSFLGKTEITGNANFTNWELNGVLGTGNSTVKGYISLGTGHLALKRIKYTVSQNNFLFTSTSYEWDTLNVRMGYQKLGLGIRITAGKKYNIDLNGYKMIANKYASNPTGFTAAITRVDRFQLYLDYKLIRDEAYQHENARVITLSFSVLFNFDKKK